mmetsp:Transcript_74467/g.212338  ORF Transcript_74467/g.212338 Transcript_74467/m.212338 type:complete len:310 (-) Transcript_74467:219-1148(-)
MWRGCGLECESYFKSPFQDPFLVPCRNVRRDALSRRWSRWSHLNIQQHLFQIQPRRRGARAVSTQAYAHEGLLTGDAIERGEGLVKEQRKIRRGIPVQLGYVLVKITLFNPTRPVDAVAHKCLRERGGRKANHRAGRSCRLTHNRCGGLCCAVHDGHGPGFWHQARGLSEVVIKLHTRTAWVVAGDIGQQRGEKGRGIARSVQPGKAPLLAQDPAFFLCVQTERSHRLSVASNQPVLEPSMHFTIPLITRGRPAQTVGPHTAAQAGRVHGGGAKVNRTLVPHIEIDPVEAHLLEGFELPAERILGRGVV